MRNRLLFVTIAAGLLVAVHFLVVEPLRSEHAKARARRSLQRAIASQDPVLITRSARNALVDLDRHGRHLAADVEVHIDRAAAYMLLENYEAAIKEYRTALRFDKRPEIYLNLGEALITSGQREAGVDALTRAVLFNPSFRMHISDGLSRAQMEDQLEKISAAGGPCRDQRYLGLRGSTSGF